MNLQDKLELAREERRPVRLLRTPERAHELRGYVIDFGAWLLMQNEEDYALNGYSLVPLAQVAEVGFFAPESDYARTCRRKELHLHLAGDDTLDLDDTRTLLRNIRKREATIVVESEHEHSDAFLLGRILRIYRSSMVLACIDSAGAWTVPSQAVKYRDLTRIGIGDNYCALFSEGGRLG